jgi:pyruvate dehydrogenase E2 component (dihydrolipoamide acetyltransferase)
VALVSADSDGGLQRLYRRSGDDPPDGRRYQPHRSWLNVLHVTQFDSAGHHRTEVFRVAAKKAAEKAGVKLVSSHAQSSRLLLLKELPDLNSSLAPSGKAIIRKK